MRAAIYARVSTFDQEPENQLVELRRYASARGWDVKEHVDHGISGAKERRPALAFIMVRGQFELLGKAWNTRDGTGFDEIARFANVAAFEHVNRSRHRAGPVAAIRREVRRRGIDHLRRG